MKEEIKIWGLLTKDAYIEKDCPPHLSEITLTLEEFEKLIREKLDKLGVKFSQCKKCGKDILFLETKAGKHAPITCGLINHFVDCPNAKDFRPLTP